MNFRHLRFRKRSGNTLQRRQSRSLRSFTRDRSTFQIFKILWCKIFCTYQTNSLLVIVRNSSLSNCFQTLNSLIYTANDSRNHEKSHSLGIAIIIFSDTRIDTFLQRLLGFEFRIYAISQDRIDLHYLYADAQISEAALFETRKNSSLDSQGIPLSGVL